MTTAVLSNADHPEFGVVTIPLPIPREQYDHCVSMLEALEIGDASAADCRLDDLWDAWPVLNCLQGMKVNLDELDYLVKRLDSFDVKEISQFQAMAEKLNLTSMKDLINLTFSCQDATVISDFSDLAAVGRDHYMNIHGGCARTEELEQLDGEETAILLIESNEGIITRYGVVYDNGTQLSQLYDGKHLPCYHYEADMTAVGLCSQREPEDSRKVTWIYLPASQGQIERAIQRSGIVNPQDMCFRMGDSMFPEEVDVALDLRCEDIYELNELAQAVGKLSHDDCIKLGAAVSIGAVIPDNQRKGLAAVRVRCEVQQRSASVREGFLVLSEAQPMKLSPLTGKIFSKRPRQHRRRSTHSLTASRYRCSSKSIRRNRICAMLSASSLTGARNP